MKAEHLRRDADHTREHWELKHETFLSYERQPEVITKTEVTSHVTDLRWILQEVTIFMMYVKRRPCLPLSQLQKSGKTGNELQNRVHSGIVWVDKMALLYLPTQIPFRIGGERVTCHWSKLRDALGRTKPHKSLGKQQLELSTRT